MSIAVGSPTHIRRVDGQDAQLLPLTFIVERQFQGKTLRSSVVEFVARNGAIVGSYSPCTTMTSLVPDDPPCSASERSDFSYLDFGAPAAFGTGFLWGKGIGPRPTLSFNAIGSPWDIAYDTKHQNGCAILSATSVIPDLRGQRFSPVDDIAQRLAFCRDDPFPQEIETATETWVSQDATAGGPAPQISETGPSPFELSLSPDAHAIANDTPYHGESDLGFPLEDALAALRQTAAYAEFERVHGKGGLRYTILESVHSGTTQVPVVGTVASDYDAKRLVIIEAQGWSLSARAEKTCQYLQACNISTLDIQTGIVGPSMTGTPLLELPYSRLFTIANETLGRAMPAPSVGTILRDTGHNAGQANDHPDVIFQDRFVYRFFGAQGAGAPPTVLIDSRTGAILRLQGERTRIEELCACTGRTQ